MRFDNLVRIGFVYRVGECCHVAKKIKMLTTPARLHVNFSLFLR